jgi:hypothetical protein
VPGIAGGDGGLFACTISHDHVFVGPLSSNERHHFCDAVVTTFLVGFTSRHTSGFSRTAAGAESAKLMMESIRRIRMNILSSECCRIVVG